MLNIISGTIMVLLLLSLWALVKAGSDADDQWNELMNESEEEK